MDEGCRQKLPIGDASLFHALQHLQCMRKLAAGEHKNICGIDDLGLKLKQSFHRNFAENRLLVFLFERTHLLLCLQPRALRYREGPLLEFVDSRDFANAPDVMEAARIEAPAVPDVVQAVLIELAPAKLLKRTRQSSSQRSEQRHGKLFQSSVRRFWG